MDRCEPPVNASKTKFLLFGNQNVLKTHGNLTLLIGDTILSKCSYYDYLDIRLDDGLTFKPHIQNLILNCNSRLFTLSHIRKYLDRKTTIAIYKNIIMAKLQYGLLFTICALKGERAKIQKVQNRVLRICGLAGRYVSNLTLHRELKVLPISLRCKFDIMVAMFKRSARDTSLNIPQGVVTRAQSVPSIHVLRPHTARFRNSISYQGPLIWESIPHHWKRIQDLDTFKRSA